MFDIDILASFISDSSSSDDDNDNDDENLKCISAAV